ncbi:hypothetical protein DL93DRAFT_2094897 [Clavulina sp. PMI_390]|nr:hypothetical protein DL93DRAFT_2094897 [Clavulina sp. PMI_390]
MAQEESRRWHDQSSPPKSHARNNRSSINADVAGRSSNRASSSQIAAKVEDSDEDRSTASRLDANPLGDINDPRRKSFSAPRTKKTSHYLDEYDNDLDYQMQSESEDELDGIGPSTKPRPSKRSHTIGSSKSHHINEGTGAKKRRVTSTGTGANKMKRT